MKLQALRSEQLSPSLDREIVDLCDRAYGEDLTALFATYGAATHVLGYVGTELATHAMWVTRWLVAGDGPPLKTAYVEMVATLPEYQRRGYATRAMRLLEETIPESYALAALCPATKPIYQRLGWHSWRGPLAIRRPDGTLLPTPDEEVMVRVLPQTPPLDFDADLSAEWRRGELW